MFCGVIRLLSILNSSTTLSSAILSTSGTEARSSSLDAAATTSPERVGRAAIVPPVVTIATCGPLNVPLLSCRKVVPLCLRHDRGSGLAAQRPREVLRVGDDRPLAPTL